MASSKSRKRRKRRRPAAAQAGSLHTNPAPKPASKPVAKRSTGLTASIDDRPPAPWGSFPLVEISVFVGLVMLILGFFFLDGSRGPIFVGTGLVLASLGGLELAIREHFAGYRSHTGLLAGFPSAAVLGILFYAGPDRLSQMARLGIAVAVFATFAFLLIRAFRSRSGGYSFKLAEFRRRR